MAYYVVPGQDLTLKTLDSGQIGYIPNDSTGGILARQGTTLYDINLQNLGSLYAQQSGRTFNSGTQAVELGKQYLTSLGIDPSSISNYSGNIADATSIPLGITRKTVGLDSALLKSLFAPQQVQRGEVFTQGVSSTNPNAPTLSSNLTGNVNLGTPTYGTAGAITPPSNIGTYVNPNPQPGTPQDMAINQGSNAAAQFFSKLPTYNPPSTISTGNISTGGTTNFTQPATTPSYNTTNLPSDVPQIGLTGPQTELQRSIDEIMGLNTQAAGRAGYQNEQNIAQGVPELTRLQNELSSRLKVSQLQAANITATTQTGQGVTSAIDQRQRAEALRLNSVESLQLYAQLEMAKGNLVTAQDAADQATNLKYAPIEAAIAAKTANIELILNSPKYTVAEKNQALQIQSQIDAQKAAVDKAKSDAADTFEIYAAASQNAGNFQPSAQYKTLAQALDAISKASPTQAIAIAAETGLNGATKDLQFISGTANQPAGYFDKTTGTFTPVGGGGGSGGGVDTSGLTPEQKSDPFIQLLLSTAGGKPITDTFAQSLNKGLNVLGQIGSLQANIQNTDTGPILGAFRGANPWDTNAQTIKAQLNAIIPNLARGVYGEVGVLTDNDIAQYSKTLPNLKSTEDIRNAVLGITVDLIGKSIKRTLEINAANQKDVSGFVDIYTEMIRTRDSIFSQIPGAKGYSTASLGSLGITPEDEALFDTTIGVSTSQTSDGGFFSNLWKGLTGQ